MSTMVQEPRAEQHIDEPPAHVPPPRRGGSVLVVDFQRDGNSGAYRTFGWSGQEPTHVWSIHGSSGLRLPPMPEAGPLVLEMDFAAASAHDYLKACVVRVFVNGACIGSTRAAARSRVRCLIPDGLAKSGEPIDVRFEHPCFVRMDFMELGRDDRPLGLCFYAVRLFPPWLRQSMDRFAPKPPEFRLIEAMAPVPCTDPDRPVQYRFARSQPGALHLGDGWIHDQDGDAWADARVCTVNLPVPEQAGQYLARFAICPLFIRSFMTFQRITILLAGAVLGHYRVGIETCLAIPLPPDLYQGDTHLRFAFAMPDGLPMHQFDPAQSPNFLSFILDSIDIDPIPERHMAVANVRDDDVAVPIPLAVSDRFLDEPVEALPAAIQSALGVEMTDILRHYESLGDNCAFGLAQRKGGCEVLGLLRFANTPLKSLMTGLADEFRATAEKAAVTLRLQDGNPGEYNLFVDRYGIRWHTAVFEGDSDEATIFTQQTMRLGYLRRKFYEALRAGRKIATISRAEPRKHPVPLPYAGEAALWEEKSDRLRFAEVLPVFLKLNEYGTNTLLYLTRCAHGRRSGTVELLAPGLMRGYVDDFVIMPEMDNRDHAAWLRVAANAWLLDQGPNASFRDKGSS